MTIWTLMVEGQALVRGKFPAVNALRIALLRNDAISRRITWIDLVAWDHEWEGEEGDDLVLTVVNPAKVVVRD
jgi:hypothetical protein